MIVDEPDRRGFARTAMSMLCQLQIVPNGSSALDEHLQNTISGLSTDVSRGGLGVWLNQEIPRRTDCIVRFFNSRKRVKPELAWGAVRRLEKRKDGFVVGVEFDTPLEFLRLTDAETTQLLGVTGKARALVVDDEPSIRNLLERFLTKRGFEVDTAADGEEALAKLYDAPPDILVMDLYMPKVNGHEVLRQIQENDIPVGVICTISGYASDDDARHCLRLGAADHLAKPLDLKQLDWSIRLRLDSVS